MYRCGLFRSNRARMHGLCRTMEHGIGSGPTVLGDRERPAEGVMVHRLSVASLDSGAESPVYGAEPASEGRMGPEARVRPEARVCPAAPVYSEAGPPWSAAAIIFNEVPPGGGVGSNTGTPAPGFKRLTAPLIPQGGATRDITVSVHRAVPGQVGAGTPQLATSYDMSVVDPQSGRWYVKDIRAATQPMGSQ